MNKMKKLLALMVTVMLFVTACQPQAEETSAAPTSAPVESPATESVNPTEESTAAPEAPAADTSNAALYATLSELAGEVGIKLPAQTSFTPASAETKLEVNGQVQTGEDGRARLDLSTGTIIRVAPSSLFTLTSNEETEGGLLTKLKLELGKVFIILNGGSTEVETPSGVASVRGSYLKVEFDAESETLTLTCLEGDCSVTTASGETKDFTNGTKIIVTKDPQTGNWMISEGEMSDEDFQEWLDNNPEAQALVEEATGGNSGGETSGGNTCFEITDPAAGASLPYQGKINFEWGEQPGASKYIVQFTNTNGSIITFETANTNLEKYVEGFLPAEGEVSWSVTAVDESGAEICTAQAQTFSKPDSNWKPEKIDDGGEEEITPVNTCANYYCNGW